MKFNVQGMTIGLTLGLVIAISLAILIGNILPPMDNNCQDQKLICHPNTLTWIISIGQWVVLTLWLSFRSNDRPKIEEVVS